MLAARVRDVDGGDGDLATGRSEEGSEGGDQIREV